MISCVGHGGLEVRYYQDVVFVICGEDSFDNKLPEVLPCLLGYIVQEIAIILRNDVQSFSDAVVLQD